MFVIMLHQVRQNSICHDEKSFQTLTLIYTKKLQAPSVIGDVKSINEKNLTDFQYKRTNNSLLRPKVHSKIEEQSLSSFKD